jgi:hypothetical protein
MLRLPCPSEVLCRIHTIRCKPQTSRCHAAAQQHEVHTNLPLRHKEKNQINIVHTPGARPLIMKGRLWANSAPYFPLFCQRQPEEVIQNTLDAE